MPPRSEFLRVAEIILKAEGNLTAQEIVSRAIGRGLFSDNLSGRTPHQTMKSKLSTHIRRAGESSIFVRTGPGRFALRGTVRDIYESRPYVKPASDERVLTFDATILDKLGRFQGVKTSTRYYDRLLRSADFSYIDRLEAEQTDGRKQVVTYIVVRRRSELLQFRRGTYNRVEDFLRGSLCIGFGGHVAERDRNLFGVRDFGISESATRELREELKFSSAGSVRLSEVSWVGILNDDSSPTGRRHFAVLFELLIPDTVDVKRGEKSVTKLGWTTPSADLPLHQYEYWSQLCLLDFFRGVTPSANALVRNRRSLKPPHVVCVLGPIGSGKTEATKVLREKLGYVEINSGAVIAKLLGLEPVPDTPREIFQQKAAEFIGSRSGPNLLAQALASAVEESGSDHVLIDGIRHRATLDALRVLIKPRRIAVLFVHTPPHLAFEFFKERERAEVTELEFFSLRESPAEGDVASLIRQADVVLYNWEGRIKYQKVIMDLLREKP